MTKTHPAFWGAAWAGLAVGGLLTVIGLANPHEFARLAGAYGLMMMGAALFLMAGLKVRERVVETAESRRVRRVALSRLPARPPAPTFGEQGQASATSTATAKTPS
ncbi:MAG TPA: hypothetical protein VIC83_02225 [Candidatus Limnocylindria bacterium]|jgi:hypothetical protein